MLERSTVTSIHKHEVSLIEFEWQKSVKSPTIVTIAKIAIALKYLGIFDVNLAGFLFSSFTFLWLVYSTKKYIFYALI